MAKELPVRSALSSAVSLVAWSAASQAYLASTSGPVSGPMWSSSAVRPSYQYREDVRIGAVLPEEGVTYYDVPPEYGAREYRYTVVNGRTVLVEPRSRRIVEIVE